jgi:hypothetical protein
MGLMEQARADAKRILTDATNGFAVSATLTAPNGTTTATVNALHVKHHLGVNTEGEMVNTKTARITIAESSLDDAGYTVRDSNGVVNLKDHRVAVKDSSGVTRQYIMRQWFPDEAVGVIMCMLDEYEA